MAGSDRDPPPFSERFKDGFIAPTPDKFAFDLLGPRVPAVLVSPWIPRAHVDDTQYTDHSSIVATLRRMFAPTAAPLKRDRHANTFEHNLSLPQPRAAGDMPDFSGFARVSRTGDPFIVEEAPDIDNLDDWTEPGVVDGLRRSATRRRASLTLLGALPGRVERCAGRKPGHDGAIGRSTGARRRIVEGERKELVMRRRTKKVRSAPSAGDLSKGVIVVFSGGFVDGMNPPEVRQRIDVYIADVNRDPFVQAHTKGQG